MTPETKAQERLYKRRAAIGLGIGAAATVALGGAFWDDIFGGGGKGPKPKAHGPGYGPLGAPNADGVMVPEGFTARRIARGEELVAGTDYRWPLAPDGAATFRTTDGGWILTQNSERLDGGVSAVRFSPDGDVTDAYRILEGTTNNCAGGPTPWGTWLSCEEVQNGQVWECDPLGRRKAVAHPAMGIFKHEAAAVDPAAKVVYLTEDLIDGAFYRFRPDRWHDLLSGTLEVAKVGAGGAVTWHRVPDPSAAKKDTRYQVPGSTVFKRAEGIWFDSGTVYVATTADMRVHAYDTRRSLITTVYNGLLDGAPILHPDNLTANRAGELFIAQDYPTHAVPIGVMTRDRKVSVFAAVTGPNHVSGEITGLAFDPSGTRLYFASQRAHRGKGEVYEISGPFFGARGATSSSAS